MKRQYISIIIIDLHQIIDDSQYEAAINEWEAKFSSEDRLKLYNQQYMTSKEEVLYHLDLHIGYIERGAANSDDDPTFATPRKLTFSKGHGTIENVMILQNRRMYLIHDSPDTDGAEWEHNIEILI